MNIKFMYFLSDMPASLAHCFCVQGKTDTNLQHGGKCLFSLPGGGKSPLRE